MQWTGRRRVVQRTGQTPLAGKIRQDNKCIMTSQTHEKTFFRKKVNGPEKDLLFVVAERYKLQTV
jgi:hypothetical protein